MSSKDQKNKSSNVWKIIFVQRICPVAGFFIVYFAVLTYLRFRKRRLLNRELDKKVPKTFKTSLATEKRYENIHYYCSVLHALLDVNEDYQEYKSFITRSSAFAFRSVLRTRFLDLYKYLVKILKSDYKHYCGSHLSGDKNSLMKSALQKSFVVRYYRFKTYDALDSFAKYSDFLVDILRQINNACKKSNSEETALIVNRMLSNLQNFHCKYKEFIGIKRKVYKKHGRLEELHYTRYFTYYYTFGHERSHFIASLRQYVEFIDNHYKNMQVFYIMDNITKNY